MDPGGKRHVMLGEDDLRVFGLLQTNTKALLYQATSVCSATKTKLVRDYAEAIRKYANANKTSTGIRDQEFPESRQRTIVQQAIPRSIHRRSQSALLTIVYEVGMTHFHQNLDYFLTPGRGPNAAANTLAHFSAWEATGEFSESLDSDIITQLVQDHCLPFLDVFPWPRVSSSDTQSALELLRRGIHAVDPLVILTLGGETSKMALADFGHTYQARSRYHYDRSRPGALHRPGTIHLRNFDALPDRKQDCDWAVIVLSNDPGSLYYSAHVRPAATRLFCLTTAIPNLLCCFLTPEKQENSKILDDKEVLCNAWKSLYQWIMRKKSRFSIETAIEDLSSFAQIEITEDDGPSEPSNSWQDEFGRGHFFNNFTFPRDVVPEDIDDERYFVFTAGGIDIRDTFGNTLGLEADALMFKLQIATIPAHQLVRVLADNPWGKAFESLWRHKTGKTLEDTMTAGDTLDNPGQESIGGHNMVIPKSFFEIGKQRPLRYVSYTQRRKNQRPEVLKLLPADPGDEIWLLDQFFLKYYPDGGLYPLSIGPQCLEQTAGICRLHDILRHSLVHPQRTQFTHFIYNLLT